MAISAVLDLYTEVVDYTVDPVGGGGSGVPTSFSEVATLPLRVNGGASADLSTSPNTWSINQFGTSAVGIVPASGGGTTNFLRADGSWASPVGSGGYTTIAEEGSNLTQRGVLNFIGADITAADNSGSSRTDVTLGRFTSITGGTVPASGGSSSAFLCADGTWKTTVGAAGQVSLQAVTPGTADVGHAHISGVMIADTAGVFGSTKKSANGVGNEKLYVKQDTSANQPVVASYFTGSPTAGFIFRAARGTEAVPLTTQNNDELVSFNVGTYTGSTYAETEMLNCTQIGSTSGGIVPFATKLMSGPASGAGSEFIYLHPNQLGGVNTIAPKSMWEVAGSYGRTPTLVTYSGVGTFVYTMTDQDNSSFVVDASGGNIEIDLKTAGGRAGRKTSFTKTDSSFYYVRIKPNGSETIAASAGQFLYKAGQSITIVSDGTNWNVESTNDWPANSSQLADSSALANSVTDTNLFSQFAFNFNRPGAVLSVKAFGKYSTTGTPTIQFRVRDGSSGLIADSGAVTCGTVTNAVFEIACQWVVRSVSGGVAATMRPVSTVLKLANSSGVFTSYSMAILSPAVIASTSNTMNVFAQWGAADPANTLTLIETLIETQPSSLIS